MSSITGEVILDVTNIIANISNKISYRSISMVSSKLRLLTKHYKSAKQHLKPDSNVNVLTRVKLMNL